AGSRNLAVGGGGGASAGRLQGAAARAEGWRAWGGSRVGRVFHGVLAVVLALAAAPVAHAASPEPVGVEVTNASEPVLCAEKDNVTVNLASKDVRRLRIEATHPAYLGSIERDSFAADWTGCSAAGDPSPTPADPRSMRTSSCGWWVSGSRPFGVRAMRSCALVIASRRVCISCRCGGSGPWAVRRSRCSTPRMAIGACGPWHLGTWHQRRSVP